MSRCYPETSTATIGASGFLLALLLVLLSLGAPTEASAEEEPVVIEEWEVPYDGRPRDPFAAGDDAVWFVGQANGYLGRLTPSSGEFFRRDLREGSGPHNLIVDDDGSVWFAGNRNAYIGRYDPKTDKIERVEMPNADARDPHTLIFDADGSHIWFTVQHGNFVGRLTLADRKVDLIPVPTKGSRPYGIKIGPDGTPWVVLFGTNKLASVDPTTLSLTEYDIPDADTRPRRLEVTDDGRVWYSDYTRGKLGRFDPETNSFAEWALPGGEDSLPYATALDGQGRVWVAETGVQPNRLVAFDLKAEEFVAVTPVPSGGGTVRHTMYDPKSGLIWFGADSGTIGKVRTNAQGSPASEE
ncbi:MAG: lyase [Pseudomonadota bacterium]